MRSPDTLAALALELEAMPARARRAVLRALDPIERRELQRAAEQSSSRAAQLSEPDDGLSGLSPWLATRVREARENGEKDNDPALTSATRRALLNCVPAQIHREPVRAKKPASLFDTVAGMLSGRGARP